MFCCIVSINLCLSLCPVAQISIAIVFWARPYYTGYIVVFVIFIIIIIIIISCLVFSKKKKKKKKFLFGNKERCGKKEIKKKVFVLFPSLKRRGFEELTFSNSLYLHNLDWGWLVVFFGFVLFTFFFFLIFFFEIRKYIKLRMSFYKIMGNFFFLFLMF